MLKSNKAKIQPIKLVLGEQLPGLWGKHVFMLSTSQRVQKLRIILSNFFLFCTHTHTHIFPILLLQYTKITSYVYG